MCKQGAAKVAIRIPLESDPNLFPGTSSLHEVELNGVLHEAEIGQQPPELPASFLDVHGSIPFSQFVRL